MIAFLFFLKYDHNQFPGVVPRTFIGALLVSILSAPLAYLTYTQTDNLFLIQLIGIEFYSLILNFVLFKLKFYFKKVRFTLAFLVTGGFFHFTSAIKKLFSSKVEKLTILITLTQFHFMFYSSRTLPNTFALIFCKYI
jgi:alpha-1,6-mannosyltransferase